MLCLILISISTLAASQTLNRHLIVAGVSSSAPPWTPTVPPCSASPTCQACAPTQLIQFLNYLRNRINLHYSIDTFKTELDSIIRQLTTYHLTYFPSTYQPFHKPTPDTAETTFVHLNPNVFDTTAYGRLANQPGYRTWSFVQDRLGIAGLKLDEWNYVAGNPRMSLSDLARRMMDPSYSPWSYVMDKVTNPESRFVLQHPERFNIPEFLAKTNTPSYKPWSYLTKRYGIQETGDPMFQEWDYILHNPKYDLMGFLDSVERGNYSPWSYVFNQDRASKQKEKEWLYVLNNPDRFNVQEFLTQSSQPGYEPWTYVMANDKTDNFLRFVPKGETEKVAEMRYGLTRTDPRYPEFRFVARNLKRYNLIDFLPKMQNPLYRPWSYVAKNPPWDWKTFGPKWKEWSFVLSHPEIYNVPQYLYEVNKPDYHPWRYVHQNFQNSEEGYPEFEYVNKNRDKFDMYEFLRQRLQPGYATWSYVRDNGGITPLDPRYKEWMTILSSKEKYNVPEYLKAAYGKFYQPGSFLEKQTEKPVEEDGWAFKGFDEKQEKRTVDEDEGGWRFKELEERKTEKYVKVQGEFMEKLLESPKFVEEVTAEVKKKYPEYSDWYTEYVDKGWMVPKVFETIKRLTSAGGFELSKYIEGKMLLGSLRGEETENYVKFEGELMEKLLKNSKFVEVVTAVVKKKHPELADWYGEYLRGSGWMSPKVFETIKRLASASDFELSKYVKGEKGKLPKYVFNRKPEEFVKPPGDWKKYLKSPKFVEEVTAEVTKKFPKYSNWYTEYLEREWLRPEVFDVMEGLKLGANFNPSKYLGKKTKVPEKIEPTSRPPNSPLRAMRSKIRQIMKRG